jgi:hypothetical protein
VSTAALPTELSSELRSVLERYQSATRAQRAAMAGIRMDMQISGRFTKLNEKGTMTIHGTISKEGELSFDKDFAFEGDNRVKTELISRYLEQEQKAKYGAMNITPQDYDFKIAAILKQGGRETYVFEINPKKKSTDRLRGELWLDGATGMPLHESGLLSQAPHLLLTKPHISRDYELRDGVSVITHFSSQIGIIGLGTAELDVNFSNFSRVASAEQVRREERL